MRARGIDLIFQCCCFKQYVCPARLQNEVGSVFVHAAGWFVYCVNTPQAAKVTTLVHFPDARPQIICHAEGSSRSQKRHHVNICVSINVHFLCLLDFVLRSVWRWWSLASFSFRFRFDYYCSYFLSSGPKFDLVATVTLGLDEVHDSVKSHDLVLENLENPCHQLPLFDHFCCRLAAEPECLSMEQTASVTLKYPSTNKSGKSSKSDPPPVFAALGGFNLAFWKKKEHRQDKNRSPLFSVSLGQVIISVFLLVFVCVCVSRHVLYTPHFSLCLFPKPPRFRKHMFSISLLTIRARPWPRTTVKLSLAPLMKTKARKSESSSGAPIIISFRPWVSASLTPARKNLRFDESYC